MTSGSGPFRRARRGSLFCVVELLASVLLIVVSSSAPGAAAEGRTLDLPQTFEGTLTVEQNHPASSFQGYGNFTKFDATATFSNLTFGKGDEGPYTLLRGTVTYGGFDTTQTVPNGKFGECSARPITSGFSLLHRFSGNHSRPRPPASRKGCLTSRFAK